MKFFEEIVPLSVLAITTIILIIAAMWPILEDTKLSHQIFLRGKWINKSLGVAKLNSIGYVFFTKFSNNEFCTPISYHMVYSKRIASMVKRLNQTKTESSISSIDSELYYSSFKSWNYIKIGCQTLTYKEATRLVNYLQKQGVSIETLIIPE